MGVGGQPFHLAALGMTDRALSIIWVSLIRLCGHGTVLCKWCKRSMDVSIATLALLSLSPLMAVVFLLVKDSLRLAPQYFGVIDLDGMVNHLPCPNFARCILKRQSEPLTNWTIRPSM